MRIFRMWIPAAIAATAIVAGCKNDSKDTPPPGKADVMIVVVSCGANCGKPARLHQRFFTNTDCSGTPFASFDQSVSATLTSNASLEPPLEIDPGPVCATAYADLNSNGTLDSGDAVSGTNSELTGTAVEGTTLVLSLDLSSNFP